MQAIAVPPRIDMDNASEALADLSRALGGSEDGERPGTETVLDLSGLAQFDSGALAVLLQLVRERPGRAVATGAPARLLFTGAPPKLRELAALYGVDELLFGAGAVG